MSRSWLRVLTVVIVVGALAGCVDGPFARANPHDPKAEVEMRLEASVDTLFGVGAIAEFVLVSTPAYPQYDIQWLHTHAAFLEHLGNGVYRVRTAPAAPIVVTVIAGWELRRASTTVVVAP